jgi:hypothetical protein
MTDDPILAGMTYGPQTMSNEKPLADIRQRELTASQRTVLAEDCERWKRLGAWQHLDDWLAFGPGLMIRRTLAMRIVFVNKPEGRGYAEAFGQLMKQDGLDTMDKYTISAVLWLHDDPERMTLLREIRDSMTAGERSRLNSPISARQRVEKVLKARNGNGEAAPSSPVTRYKQRIAEQDREIAALKDRLARAQGNGSLFDLKLDTVDNIAAAIVEHLAPTRSENIANAIKAKLKAKVKPAG